MVDSRATTGVPDDIADFTSGLMHTTELTCRFVANLLVMQFLIRNIAGWTVVRLIVPKSAYVHCTWEFGIKIQPSIILKRNKSDYASRLFNHS